jgi:hypothetical protein
MALIEKMVSSGQIGSDRAALSTCVCAESTFLSVRSRRQEQSGSMKDHKL